VLSFFFVLNIEILGGPAANLVHHGVVLVEELEILRDN
jgi:hypothetical protein